MSDDLPLNMAQANPPAPTVEERLVALEAAVHALQEGLNQRGKQFKPPTLEEARLAAVKAGLPESEADLFWNYYESKGWKVGNATMRRWLSALTGWKLRWQGRQQRIAQRLNPSPSRSFMTPDDRRRYGLD